MVACPEIVPELLEPAETLSVTRQELRAFVVDMIERLNLIAPAAITLGLRHH